MKKKLPTVTVAISAYNEESNIEAFLHSVFKQKEEGFILKHVWVYSDGSTDRTVSILKKMTSKFPVLKLSITRTRRGKVTHMNSFYRKVDSDILVQSDADVILTHPCVIRDLINPLRTDSSVGLCGGNPQPLPAQTFTEKAINCTFEAYEEFRRRVRGGNNIFSVHGRLLACRRNFIKQLTIPSDMLADDLFIYLCCTTKKMGYRYIPTATVWFRSPQTLKDHIRQNTRFLFSQTILSKYFPTDMVRRENEIPLRLKLRSYALQFIRNPVLCGYIFFVNQYCRIRAKQKDLHVSTQWDIVWSSKNLKAYKSV